MAKSVELAKENTQLNSCGELKAADCKLRQPLAFLFCRSLAQSLSFLAEVGSPNLQISRSVGLSHLAFWLFSDSRNSNRLKRWIEARRQYLAD